METALFGVLVCTRIGGEKLESHFLEVSNYLNSSCSLVCTSWEQLDGFARLWGESCSVPLGEDKSSDKRPLLSCTILRCNKSYDCSNFPLVLHSHPLVKVIQIHVYGEFGMWGPSRKEGIQIYFLWRCWLIFSRIKNKNNLDIIIETYA